MKNSFTDSLFFNICVKGISGALVGIISGAILGFVIFGLGLTLNTLNKTIEPNCTDGKGGMYDPSCNYYQGGSFPATQAEDLGMAFGALIGGIMGSAAAFKEKKTK